MGKVYIMYFFYHNLNIFENWLTERMEVLILDEVQELYKCLFLSSKKVFVFNWVLKV